MTLPPLTVRQLRWTPVEVPMNHALGTSRAVIRAAPLMLIDLETEEGITGRAYLFCYLRASAVGIAGMLGEIDRLVKGQRVDPAAQFTALAKRFTLIGVQGIVRMALSGFDVAAWDALAVAAGQPLGAWLGAKASSIRAYNSNGLGLMEPAKLADEAEELLDGGFPALKLRLGHETLAADLAALHAVRERIGEDVAIMVDYNQALSVDEALARGNALDAENVCWLEEPIRHDDYAGAARLAKALKTPVQIGENFSLPAAMEEALGRGACDYAMPDLERIGGVTGWREAASIAERHGIPMSSHLFPEVSAHLLAATPTAHWLEYVDWASTILAEPLKIEKGAAILPTRPGSGIEWNRDAVERYRIS
jgi:mandelate racemase